MSNTKTLCIIDSDVCFTSLLISRLRKHLPNVLSFCIPKETLTRRADLFLDNHFVLYNQKEITEEELLRHCSRERMPVLIPLLFTTPPYQPKDVLMLVHEVEEACGIGRIPPSLTNSVQTCLILSFVSREEREKHVLRQIENARFDFRTIVRLDIMPGILMAPDPSHIVSAPSSDRSDGISDLLNRIRFRTLTASDIPGYLEPDPYGDLRFGRPRHSDDIISSHTHTILTLIQRTARYLASLNEPALLLVVGDGLSFTRMRALCRNLSHLEILTPLDLEKDFMLCSEIDALQQAHSGTSHLDFPYDLSGRFTLHKKQVERSMTMS